MSEAPAAPRADWDSWRVLPSRVYALCLVELQKLRHDRSELVARAIQPACLNPLRLLGVLVVVVLASAFFSCAQPRQPAVLRGRRAAWTAYRYAGAPAARLRRPGRMC